MGDYRVDDSASRFLQHFFDTSHSAILSNKILYSIAAHMISIVTRSVLFPPPGRANIIEREVATKRGLIPNTEQPRVLEGLGLSLSCALP